MRIKRTVKYSGGDLDILAEKDVRSSASKSLSEECKKLLFELAVKTWKN